MHLTKFDPEEANGVAAKKKGGKNKCKKSKANGAAAGAAAGTSASNPALVESNALPDLIAT